jgi:hypothetical protein
MIGRPRRGSQSSDLRTDIESWLASNSVDRVANYVARGRRHSSLQDDPLFEAWKSAMRAMAADPFSKERRMHEDDLVAEIKLRGLTVPYEDVKDAFEKLISSAVKMAETLSQYPDDAERINEEIVKDIQEFKNKRDRAQ